MAAPRRLKEGVGGPGFGVVETAARAIERYRMFPGGGSVVVAVSGGPDSTCLLDVLDRLSSTFDLALAVAHVDHGLSPSSADVAARVAHSAAARGFEAHVVRAPDLSGPNLHARARAFRYGFFDTIAAKEGARWVATGHTLDDRVETTLARLVHGAATEGLAGLPPAEERRMRPLVGLRRRETRAYCDERSLDFFDDPANADPRFERATIRDELVAAVEQRWGDGAVRAMASSAEHLLEDAAILRSLANDHYGRLAVPSEGAIRFDRATLEGLARGLRRRLLERAVGRMRDRSGGIESALDALDRGAKPGARFALGAGAEIVFSKEQVTVLTDRVEDVKDA